MYGRLSFPAARSLNVRIVARIDALEADMAIIYVGIDGTGEGDWEEYAKEMFNSFVQRLWTRWEWHGHRHYLRGPTRVKPILS